jgi:ferredoxin/flavodoxin
VAGSFLIAYCSPAGTTRHVADVIQQELGDVSATVQVMDLARVDQRAAFRRLVEACAADDCLFVGSPVYRSVAVPPVMEFLESLSPVGAGWAVPFVTWGGVSSGIALWQMAQTLVRKGFRIAAAAKIAAVHSIMWRSADPLGAGHPDGDDDAAVGRMIRTFVQNLTRGTMRPLDPADLDYQNESDAVNAKKTIGQPWMVTPKTVDHERCTQCGVCQVECPTGAITLSPFPVYGQGCIDCFNCLRLCPEEAIQSAMPLEERARMIEKFADHFRESIQPVVFIN